ncbi:MAG: oxidoreductase [Acidimicrobiia bacterium]|nr:oxidoreductase [Acidimicrobiia bacterium]
MQTLTGRVALVTGSSSGLGERFARVLHEAGATVVLTARREDRLAEVARQLDDAVWLAGNIADAQHRVDLMQLVQDHFGRLDVLVNNAGINDNGRLEDQTLEDLTSVIDVNLVAVMDLCRLAAPLLFAAEHASVINVASMYGVVGSRGPMAAYNATKGAIVNFSRHLAAQWGSRGVRVNTLAPSYFPSEMTGYLGGGLDRAIEKSTLLGRVPRSDELDGPLLYLASDASSYVTGHTLVVDGGWTAV